MHSINTSFYQYVLKKGNIKNDPTLHIQSPKIEKRVPCVLTSKEVELLLEQPKNVDLKGIRDKAMLELHMLQDEGYRNYIFRYR